MLAHLSNTSPYVCDLNCGPIEQANRMASAPTKRVSALLEQKESFPKQTRTPLKLLAPDEIPMDTTATTTDINASLQPIWYTEQTIVDDTHVQQEHIASIIQEQQQQRKSSLRRSTIARSTLPPIQSIDPTIIEENELPSQRSLMHKSSTFTIEPESSINIDTPLNDSEKENVIKEDIIQPSDDSFRALENLLGLTSTATVRESPKTNHDTLSLTVVTPTDIINSTTTSLRMSYVPKDGSLPSSQNIPTMPTIESINSTMPPAFLVDNTDIEEEEQPSIINRQMSVDMTDNDTIKDDTNTDDETNFSFELNDFPNESTDSVAAPPPPPPVITIRAPTCADVAYRALIKPRLGGRVSQPVKADSPLAKTNKIRSSAPTSRFLRSSCRRISTDALLQNSTIQDQPSNIECFINSNTTTNEPLIEVITLPEEEEEIEQEKTTSVTLNLTSSKDIEEVKQNASIQSEKTATPTKPLMPLLSREYTYNTPKTRSSNRHHSRQQETNSPSIASKSMLGILLTNPSEGTPKLLQNSITISASPSPEPTSTRTTRKSERSSSNPTPRVSINPLHSSTLSTRNKSLQMVSIGEQEQVSTIVPQQIEIEEDTEMVPLNDSEPEHIEMVPLNDCETEHIEMVPLNDSEPEHIEIIPLNDTKQSIQRPSIRTIEIGVQTTPSLNASSRRRLDTIEQQTTPTVRVSKSSSIVIVNEQQTTPLQIKPIINIQRNVRFQLTPSTDLRLTTKEKIEEKIPRLKPEIIINPTPIISENKIKEKPVKKVTKTKKKKIVAAKKTETKKAPQPRTTRRAPKKEQNKPLQTPAEVVLPIKRAQRKRSNPEATTNPVVKRAKTSKSVEVKQPLRVPSPSPKRSRTRTRSVKKTVQSIERQPKIKATVPSIERQPRAKKTVPLIEQQPKTKETVQPVERQSRVKKTVESIERQPKTKETVQPVERQPRAKKIPTNAKLKDTSSTVRSGKRRLQSVEPKEKINPANEETVQSILPVQNSELSQEERQKIEGLTVAGLKTRLNTHKEDIPKGAKKADLIALLLKIETNLPKERKESEPTTAKRTRRRNN